MNHRWLQKQHLSESLQTFNHRWIQILDVIHLQAIDDEQRTDITTIGRITTDTDIGSLTRTIRVDNLYTSGYDYTKMNRGDYGFQGDFMSNGIITPGREWTAQALRLPGQT